MITYLTSEMAFSIRTTALLVTIGRTAGFAKAGLGAPRASTRLMASLADFTATMNGGAEKKLSEFVGKPSFVANIASL